MPKNKSKKPKYDFAEELKDSHCRYVSPSLSIYYDTPGTMFSVEDNRIIEIRDLSTGDYLKFDLGTNTPKQGLLENAYL